MFCPNCQALAKYNITKITFYLNSLPAPLPVFGVVGEPPHVHVRLYDLGAEDEVLLVLAGGDGLDPAVETKRLRTQLQT